MPPLHDHDVPEPPAVMDHPRDRVAPLTAPGGGALADPTYRRLLAAQIVSLAGTGVTTVALGLLAFDLAGTNAGAVLGAALTLKMVAYVGLSPVIAGFAHRVDRRRLLITLDLVRAGVLVSLPFVTQVWEVLALVFIVNACAAGFTPAFQATLPDVLPDEEDYTRALSFSRAAYDLADLLAPVAAAAMLLVISFHGLFAVNAVTFLISAALIASIALPASRAASVSDRTWARITLGARRFVATPSLRGLLALNLATASASAMVIVNTVVLVRGTFDLGASQVAVALAVSGAGSVMTALAVPRLLHHARERTVMLGGATLLAIGLLTTATLVTSYPALLGVWLLSGAGLALVQTPIGRVIVHAAAPADRPPLFAAQFALSHLCWLLTYPVAGVLGSVIGVTNVAFILAGSCIAATVAAARIWTSSPAMAATH